MKDLRKEMAEKSSLPCFLQTSSSSVGEGSIAMPSVPCPRERFYVELKAGETTFVSWKKLQKESQKSWSVMGPNSVDAPFGAHPALEARIAPEVRTHRSSFMFIWLENSPKS
jgi:ubinuclein